MADDDVSAVVATALPPELLAELDDLAEALRGTRLEAAAGALSRGAMLRLAVDAGLRALPAGLEAPPEGWPDTGGQPLRLRLRLELIASLGLLAEARGLSRYAALRVAVAAGVRVLRADAGIRPEAEGRGLVSRSKLTDPTWSAAATVAELRAELDAMALAAGVPADVVELANRKPAPPTVAEAVATMNALTEGTPAAEPPEAERRAELPELPHGQVERRDGERLRAWRESFGLSQGEFAKRIGVGQATVTRWEGAKDAEGNPRPWPPKVRARIEAMMLNPPVELLES
jgi:DNA-binding transcriptional regulator YiaG/predicted transcriptional regulator